MSKPPDRRRGVANVGTVAANNGKKRPMLDFEMLQLVLSDELDFLSDDDTEFMPYEAVREQLSTIGFGHSSEFDLGCSTSLAWIAAEPRSMASKVISALAHWHLAYAFLGLFSLQNSCRT